MEGFVFLRCQMWFINATGVRTQNVRPNIDSNICYYIGLAIVCGGYINVLSVFNIITHIYYIMMHIIHID